MSLTSFDPGLTQQYTGRVNRMIREDGSFNVHRVNARWQDSGFYLYSMRMGWPAFLAVLPAVYILVNLGFAALYWAIGVENLQGAVIGSTMDEFLSAFFFSVQTFTTVGYGHIAPKGILTSAVAAAEAMVGLLAFALATGLLYGRFSRPSAKLAFSDQAVVAPYLEGQALMFRVANRRPNVLMEIEALVLLMTVVDEGGEKKRKYERLPLEMTKVHFLPLTWTIVHAIDEASPLYGKSDEDLAALQPEVLVLIRAFDDSFSQIVHAKRSYTWDEVLWNARFRPAFFATSHGDLAVDLSRVSDYEPL